MPPRAKSAAPVTRSRSPPRDRGRAQPPGPPARRRLEQAEAFSSSSPVSSSSAGGSAPGDDDASESSSSFTSGDENPGEEFDEDDEAEVANDGGDSDGGDDDDDDEEDDEDEADDEDDDDEDDDEDEEDEEEETTPQRPKPKNTPRDPSSSIASAEMSSTIESSSALDSSPYAKRRGSASESEAAESDGSADSEEAFLREVDREHVDATRVNAMLGRQRPDVSKMTARQRARMVREEAAGNADMLDAVDSSLMALEAPSASPGKRRAAAGADADVARVEKLKQRQHQKERRLQEEKRATLAKLLNMGGASGRSGDDATGDAAAGDSLKTAAPLPTVARYRVAAEETPEYLAWRKLRTPSPGADGARKTRDAASRQREKEKQQAAAAEAAAAAAAVTASANKTAEGRMASRSTLSSAPPAADKQRLATIDRSAVPTFSIKAAISFPTGYADALTKEAAALEDPMLAREARYHCTLFNCG